MCSATVVSILLCCLIHLVGIVIFLGGFFPLKPALHETASVNDNCFALRDNCCGANGSSLPDDECMLQPVYSRLVIVLIDALRTDFVLPEVDTDGKYRSCHEPRMYKACQHIVNQQTASYHAVAHPPTVTMPRIKVRYITNYN